jgi:hypothetical protein
MEEEEENETNIRPECPYCGDESGECSHVLLDYDASFQEYLSGHMSELADPFAELRKALAEAIRSGKMPKVKRGYVKSIWDFAVENFTEGQAEAEIDEDAYFSELKYEIDFYDGEACTYSDEDGAPGYSSAYIIFYAKDPDDTLQRFNQYILNTIIG